VRVTEGAFGITVEINASVLSRRARPSLGPMRCALRAVGQVVADAEFPITVEGHTDVTPIATPMFPSNWELSAVRASSVVRLFVDSGVRPARLTAAGYGDQRPVADNATSEGRARNRRVTILIESRVAEPVVTVPPRASGVTDSILPSDAAPPPPPKRRKQQSLEAGRRARRAWRNLPRCREGENSLKEERPLGGAGFRTNRNAGWRRSGGIGRRGRRFAGVRLRRAAR
jgi:chemotaxis protein MotB